MVEDLRLEFKVEFKTSEVASIVYEAILPEVNDHRFERSQVFVELHSNELKFNITSRDISAAKANINTIFRWIGVVSESIRIVPKKIVKGNDKPK
ncbi:MAG: KEOPS complex subunit Pcc1 [Candidatus Hodarchaeales archaeon]